MYNNNNELVSKINIINSVSLFINLSNYQIHNKFNISKYIVCCISLYHIHTYLYDISFSLHIFMYIV